MFKDNEIKVINNFDNLLPTYKTNIFLELLKNNLEQIVVKETSQEKCDRFVSNVKLIENFIIIISTKTSKNLSELNSIKILGFEISIIKLNLNPGEEKSEINISIPLKDPKIITNKNFLVQKYFFSDFIKVSEEKNYFHICVFEQLHIYKIYIKDNQLKYNKIELKKFNEKTKVLYLGEYFNKKENILEIDLLLKPNNNLLILEINSDEKSQNIEEKIYDFKNNQNIKYSNKNIFHKFLRSFCGKFLFTEKETDKKYLIYRENDEMIIKQVNLDILNNNEANSNYMNFLYTYEDKIFLLAELPKQNEEEDGYIILGIFNLVFNGEQDIYEPKLIQKIMFRNEEGIKDYSININMEKDISIQIGDTLLYIQLGKNSSVEKIFKLNTNGKELEISKFICVKYENWFILLSFLKENLFISKYNIAECDDIENNCVINYDFKELMVNCEEKLEENNNKDNKEQEIDIIIKENNRNEKYSSEKLQDIIINLNDYMDKIINDRIDQNYKKFESIKENFEKKFEMIEQDILAQKKENEKLEKSLDEILNKICELNGNNNDQKSSANSDSNSIDCDINNLKNINEMFKSSNSFPKNDNINFMPFMKRMNTMRMIQPFNFFGNEKLFNNPLIMNDPRIAQLFNTGYMNQGNNFFQMKNK